MTIPEPDIMILNSLPFDQSLNPNFEILKECLIWEDERPQVPLSSEGREFLYDLWIIRGFFHRGVAETEWSISSPAPQYFKDVWAFGLKNVPFWPGFKRLILSEVDNAYLNSCLSEGFKDY